MDILRVHCVQETPASLLAFLLGPTFFYSRWKLGAVCCLVPHTVQEGVWDGGSGTMAVLEQHGWPQGPCWSGSPGCSAAHRKIAVVGEATPITSVDTVCATNCVLLRKVTCQISIQADVLCFRSTKTQEDTWSYILSSTERPSNNTLILDLL